MIHLVVVGLGRQGRRHLRAARAHPGVIVAGTVDPMAAGVEGIPHFSALDMALNTLTAVDAAIVATPSVDHARSARLLLERGVPVLVEKPLATTVEDAVEVVARARRSEATLAVGHVERFNPAVQLVRALLGRGSLGRPVALAFRRIGLPPPGLLGTDVIHDLAVHDIDVFGLLVGSALELRGASGWSSDNVVESACLLFDAGDVNGLVHVNWRTPVRLRDFTVTTDECWIEANYTTQRVDVVYGPTQEDFVEFAPFPRHYRTARRRRLECQPVEPLAEQLHAFITAVESDGSGSVLASGEDGLRALALAHAASVALKADASRPR